MSLQHFFCLSDLDLPVKVKITSLAGKWLPDAAFLATHRDAAALPLRGTELFVVAQIHNSGMPVGVPVQTTPRTFASSLDVAFDEWVTFPVCFRELTPSSTLALTVYEVAHPVPPRALRPDPDVFLDFPATLYDEGLWAPRVRPVGGTCLPFFDRNGRLKLGTRRLALAPGVVGDGSVDSATPHRPPQRAAALGVRDEARDHLQRAPAASSLALGLARAAGQKPVASSNSNSSSSAAAAAAAAGSGDWSGDGGSGNSGGVNGVGDAEAEPSVSLSRYGAYRFAHPDLDAAVLAGDVAAQNALLAKEIAMVSAAAAAHYAAANNNNNNNNNYNNKDNAKSVKTLANSEAGSAIDADAGAEAESKTEPDAEADEALIATFSSAHVTGPEPPVAGADLEAIGRVLARASRFAPADAALTASLLLGVPTRPVAANNGNRDGGGYGDGAESGGSTGVSRALVLHNGCNGSNSAAAVCGGLPGGDPTPRFLSSALAPAPLSLSSAASALPALEQSLHAALLGALDAEPRTARRPAAPVAPAAGAAALAPGSDWLSALAAARFAETEAQERLAALAPAPVALACTHWAPPEGAGAVPRDAVALYGGGLTSAADGSGLTSLYNPAAHFSHAPPLTLTIDSAPFRFPVVYHHNEAPQRIPSVLPVTDRHRRLVTYDPDAACPLPTSAALTAVLALAAGLPAPPPSAGDLAAIAEVLRQPLRTRLTLPQRMAMVRNGAYLAADPAALAPYLGAVAWSDRAEAEEALRVLPTWARISPASALALLRPSLPSQVWHFAVKQLRESASDEDIDTFLLQLVQALRYERAGPMHTGLLATLLIERCARCGYLANALYWFLVTEGYDRSRGLEFKRVLERFMATLLAVRPAWHAELLAQTRYLKRMNDLSRAVSSKSKAAQKIPLLRGLLARDESLPMPAAGADPALEAPVDNFQDLAVMSPPIALPLFPQIQLASTVATSCTVFKSAKAPFLMTHRTVGTASAADGADGNGNSGRSAGRTFSAMFASATSRFIANLSGSNTSPSASTAGAAETASAGDDDDAAAAAAAAAEAAAVAADPVVTFSAPPPGPLPMGMSATLGCEPKGDAHLGRQVVAPGGEYKVIFKSGDDLRQDQLILQLFGLMDRLLKTHLLDLRLTPYRVIATSPDDGFVEFVANSHTIQDIEAEHSKDLKKFFCHHNPKQKDQAEVLNTFVKSCAGYCVMTYLLGIGDRHLENILITTDGHMFHIDFGFIFGKDPKPGPPPMKFSRQMFEAMGGAQSAHYRDFRHYCCLAFNILRKHANLIITLLTLMADAGIPNMMDAPETHISKVQDNFQLALTDEEASHYILGKIDESLGAFLTVVNDKIHSFASYWK